MLKYILLVGCVLLAVACSTPEEKVEEYLSSAASLFREGKLEKSAIEYRNALEINQNLPAAWFGLATIYERKQDWRNAYAVLIKVRELAPDFLDGRVMLAQILLASNQLDQALLDAKDILEMAPEDARSHALMAAVKFRLHTFEGARQDVEKALAIDPANSEAILVHARLLTVDKKYKQAVAVLDKAIKLDPGNVSLYLMKTRAYFETGDKKAIVAVYRSLIQRFPDNVQFKKILARRYIEANEIDDAEKILEKVVASNPDDVAEKMGLVSFKYRYRSIDDAVALLKNYIKTDNKEFRYRFLLGELYEKSKLPEQAKSVYQAIIADDGLQSSGLKARNRIAYLELREGQHEDARQLIEEVIKQDRNNATGLLLQASLYIADQKYDDAVVNIRTVLRDDPDSVKALAFLGQAYSAMASPDLALESYYRAFQLSPATPEVANQLAFVLIRQGKHAQADEVLQQSVSRGNRSMEALKLMVQSKLALGDWDKAEQLARQLQKLKGQEAFSQQMLGLVYQGKDQRDDSIEAFKRAHELSPDAVQPIVALVKSYVMIGKIDEARSFLASVLSVDNDNASAHLLLGQLSLGEKNFTEAEKYFSKVIEVRPDADVGYRSLARLYQFKRDFIRAKRVINQALAIMPDRPIMLMSLASVHESGGEFDDAISVYLELLEKNPDLVIARNNLASLLTDHRSDVESLAKARQISSEFKDSQIPQFRDTYAWASVVSGTNLEEAIRILKGIVRENDQVDVYNYHLGEAYLKNGNRKNALAYLTRAAEQTRPGSNVALRVAQSLERLEQP